MHFCAIHLDEDGPAGCGEEVFVVVPGAAKTAIAVPLDGLPLLEQAVGSESHPLCPACGSEIPRLRRVCPDAQSEAADPG